MPTIEELRDSNYVVLKGTSLDEAMRAITYNHRGCLIVVDEHDVVVGVASDGDIRRAMVKGAIAQTPIEKVMNANFTSVPADDTEVRDKPEKLFADNSFLQVIPVVSEGNTLVDLIVEGGMHKE